MAYKAGERWNDSTYQGCRCDGCRAPHAAAVRDRRDRSADRDAWTDKRKRSNTLLLDALDRCGLTEEQFLQLLVNKRRRTGGTAGPGRRELSRESAPAPARPGCAIAHRRSAELHARWAAAEGDTTSELPDAAQDESHTADFDAAAERFRQRIVAQSGVARPRKRPAQQSGTVPVASGPVSEAAETVLGYLKSRAPAARSPVRAGRRPWTSPRSGAGSRVMSVMR